MQQTLIQHIATIVDAYHTCVRTNEQIWRNRHLARLQTIERCCLPSGAGFDNGTTIALDASNADKIVFATAFHHMNDNGFYTKWTQHNVTVRPSFIHGVDIKISGRDYRGIKDYIYETFELALNTPITDQLTESINNAMEAQ